MNEGPITAVGQHRPLKVEQCRAIDTSLWITRDSSIAISPDDACGNLHVF